MTLAADLLIERRAATVAEVAAAVGYSDPFGFSAAFKRIRGVNPSEFRRTTTAGSRPPERFTRSRRNDRRAVTRD
jgi:AraC-like DNA-binding protein